MLAKRRRARKIKNLDCKNQNEKNEIWRQTQRQRASNNAGEYYFLANWQKMKPGACCACRSYTADRSYASHFYVLLIDSISQSHLQEQPSSVVSTFYCREQISLILIVLSLLFGFDSCIFLVFFDLMIRHGNCEKYWYMKVVATRYEKPVFMSICNIIRTISHLLISNMHAICRIQLKTRLQLMLHIDAFT